MRIQFFSEKLYFCYLWSKARSANLELDSIFFFMIINIWYDHQLNQGDVRGGAGLTLLTNKCNFFFLQTQNNWKRCSRKQNWKRSFFMLKTSKFFTVFQTLIVRILHTCILLQLAFTFHYQYSFRIFNFNFTFRYVIFWATG